jgi:hypothetical protein
MKQFITLVAGSFGKKLIKFVTTIMLPNAIAAI